MRNTVNLCVILCFFLHNVTSKKPDQTRSELKPDSEKPKHTGEKMDISKFVDILIRDAKRINEKHKNGKGLQRTTEKTKTYTKTHTKIHKKTNTKTVNQGFESSYDSIGLADDTNVQFVRSQSPGIDLKKIEHNIFRSNAAPDDNKMKEGALRSVDRPSVEEGAELLFDLEDEDVLKNPLY